MAFNNLPLSLLFEHDGRAYYIKIYRYVRTEPFSSMKQPTPFGGLLGRDCVLLIKHNGLPAERRWRLYEDDEIVAEGITDKEGKAYSLPIKMPYMGVYQYGFEMISGEEVATAGIEPAGGSYPNSS